MRQKSILRKYTICVCWEKREGRRGKGEVKEKGEGREKGAVRRRKEKAGRIREGEGRKLGGREEEEEEEPYTSLRAPSS
jgi:hypothetical protein